ANQSIKIDTNNDGEIQVSEALDVYRLEVQNSNIGNLTGIEVFTNLTHLYCQNNNPLTELDVSNNVNLIKLDCSGTSLTELDVSNNINLTHLYCSSSLNNFTELNLSNNVNLTYFS